MLAMYCTDKLSVCFITCKHGQITQRDKLTELAALLLLFAFQKVMVFKRSEPSWQTLQGTMIYYSCKV